MAVSFLDFEQPIAELEAKIEELRHVTSESEVNIQDEITRLQAKSRQLTSSIFASLTPWQITQLARHPYRPYTLDYVNAICSEFNELHGDHVCRRRRHRRRVGAHRRARAHDHRPPERP